MSHGGDMNELDVYGSCYCLLADYTRHLAVRYKGN